MGVIVQLIQIADETLFEFSGIKEISGVYFDDSDVNIAVNSFGDAHAKKVELSISPNKAESFAPFSLDIQKVLDQRITADRLLNGSSIILIPCSIDEDFNDVQALKDWMKTNGGIWLEGLPKEITNDIVKCWLC